MARGGDSSLQCLDESVSYTACLPTAIPFFLLVPLSVMVRRRTVYTCLCLLAAVLVGTVIVLSSISYYLNIDLAAYITEDELDAPFDDSRWNASQHGKVERVPRIIHQTWKSETLPKKWTKISQHCQDMMPD